MANDRSVLSDDDREEVAPGVIKRVGDCTPAELESAVALRKEKTRLIDEISDLKRLAAERNLILPRARQRALARLEAHADKTGRIRDLQRVHEVFSSVVHGGER